MRKIIFQMLISYDGFYEGLNRDVDWDSVGKGFHKYSADFLDNVDTLTFDEKSYQHMEDYHPVALETINKPNVAAQLENIQNMLVSKILHKVEWSNTLIIKEVILEELLALKQQPSFNKQQSIDMMIFANVDLTFFFILNNLTGEFRIMMDPVILGNGKILFQDIVHGY